MTKALFIGQAPPRIVDETPFGRTHLYRWLASVGISQEEALSDFAYTALVPVFPGVKGRSHRPPNPAEIAAHRPALLERVALLNPPVIVPVGILSARQTLQDDTLLLQQIIGRRFEVIPFGEPTLGSRIIIPLPHPSGASAWIYQHDNAALLAKALELLAKEVR